MTAGPVFTDRTARLAPLRAALRWYPPEVERYLLAAGWRRLAQQLPFVAAVTAPTWPERELALADAAETLLDAQRGRGLPLPGRAVVRFWDRPYRTVDEEIVRLLLAEIADPPLRGLPPIGSVEQWANSVDVRSHAGRRARLATLSGMYENVYDRRDVGGGIG